MLESPKFIDNDNYQGSRAFTWLADMCGLSVDLVSIEQLIFAAYDSFQVNSELTKSYSYQMNMYLLSVPTT
ncbi:unnamed protein product [Ceratitis capitata]|uniref:(Mediterranean fruit fly) hypothetical protein n=1 Tax=Ceratitis capitata TaxID=7213 RepID=A0A811VEX8_CERCA|nr:unnamed protein product [Ceratitis capitata]